MPPAPPPSPDPSMYAIELLDPIAVWVFRSRIQPVISAFSSSSNRLSELLLPMNETVHGMSDKKVLVSE